MRGDFSNEAGRDSKSEMSFPVGQVGSKERKTNNIAGQSGSIKQRWSFQTTGLNINNVSDLGDKKCKCANEMCLSVFVTDL